MGLKFLAQDQISKIVKVWLIIGIVMVFMQVVIGGVTRITGSGLSITKWDIVTGTLPPLNSAQWDTEFDLYKETPQYEKINQGMAMSEFKFIYFWEYFHRLWARTMGFVFLIPFLFFLFTKKLSKVLTRDLLLVILLTIFVASLGWIMVKSGLNDRPWVDAYKLTFHLSLALIMFSYLLWTTYKVFSPKRSVINNSVLITGSRAFLFVLAIQIFLGGIMSGMKAGLFFPTWPDMNGVYLPDTLLTAANWNVDNFIFYDTNSFMPAFIQFAHRSTAYLLIIIGLTMVFKLRKNKIPTFHLRNIYMLITMLVIQATLGILTVINCKGSIPVGYGVLHQAGALILLGIALLLVYKSPKKSY
ncbi:MAG: cytochrome c oxidase assembly protein subunit 15 [Polaribacter sp.]|jgi:cytochrome c oxidase assembly protein subunit 15